MFNVVNVLLASGKATLGYWNGARWWVIGDRDGDVKKWTELLQNVSLTGGKPDFQFEAP